MKKILVKSFRNLSLIVSLALTGCNAGQSNQNQNSNDTEFGDNNKNTFNVTWVNYDGSILEVDENVSYGETPSYDGNDPQRESTDDFKYVFTGWSPEISPVKSDVTYVAQFKITPESAFTVTWVNYDGSVLEVDENVSYGEMPSYNGNDPQRESTDDFKYVFTGWSPEISPVKSDVTYVAQFKTMSRYTYKVTWRNYDGTILKVDDAPFGSFPTYDGDIPEKTSDTFYDYTFSGWYPELDTVLRDTTYTAQFKSVYKYDYLNFYFDIKEDDNSEKYIELTSAYSSKPIDFVIPPYVNVDDENIPVKSIDSNAFSGYLGDVVVGRGTLLKSITIPNTITNISSRAFQYYSEDYGGTDLTSIIIPKSVTTMGRYAFSYCDGFSIYCEALTKPDGWDTEWHGKGKYDGKLPVVWGYAGIDRITQDGFEYAVCQNDRGEKSITITGYEGNNETLTFPEKININGDDLNVTTISHDAFCGNKTITDFTIPNSVTTIDQEAFCRSDALHSVYIPKNVAYIGKYAFTYCENLTIYCEATSRPEKREKEWRDDTSNIIWGVSYDEYLKSVSA